MLLLASLPSCKKSDINSVTNGQPGEVAAIITKVDLSALADCACCARYQIQIGSDKFQADQLPVSFESLTANVWLKYDRQQLSGECSQVQNRIGVTSVRNR